jgi:hypothetical protein
MVADDFARVILVKVISGIAGFLFFLGVKSAPPPHPEPFI